MPEVLDKPQTENPVKVAKKRGRKPKVLSPSDPVKQAAPVQDASLKDLILSQQLVINSMKSRLHYLETSVKNWTDLSKALGGSFGKFKFDPPQAV